METENYKYQEIPNDSMGTQINLRLSNEMLSSVKTHAKKNGFGSVQEFIKETVRKEIYNEEDELTKKELSLIKRLIKVSDEKNLYGTEKELFEVLRRK